MALVHSDEKRRITNSLEVDMKAYGGRFMARMYSKKEEGGRVDSV